MSRDRSNTPLNAAAGSEFLPARPQTRRGRSRRRQARGQIDRLLVVALVGVACVREYPAGAPIPGVACLEGGTCLRQEIDSRQSTYALVPGCGQPAADGPFRVGIAAQRMTLTAGGLDVVFSGLGAWVADGTEAGGAGIAVASFDASADCPHLRLLNDPEHPGASNGAHLLGPGGALYALVGPAAGTVQVLAQAGAGWNTRDVQPPASSPADAPNWNMPNAVAARLDGGSAVVVRSATSGDAAKQSVPSLIEWLDGFPDAPVRGFEKWIAPSTQAQSAIVSTLGHVRLFPGLDSGSRASGGFLLMGDSGPPMLFARGNGGEPPRRLDERSAQDPAPNLGAATVLLPLRPGQRGYQEGSVLCIGGGHPSSDPLATSPIDLFDPTAGTWRTVASLPYFWTFGTAALLPDGHILVAGGSGGDLRLFYLDPGADFAVTIGHDPLSRPRGAGVGALVLADGRVLIGSGMVPDAKPASAPPDFEVWEPPYLERARGAPGPAVREVWGPVRAGAGFAIQLAPDGPDVAEVVLLAYGSSFMGNDLNQRLIQLDIDGAGYDPRSGTLALTGPPPGWAPAGRYLLFALDARRIPSIGVPVDVLD